MVAAHPTSTVSLAHVKREVRAAIARVADRPKLRAFLERLLSQPGRVLAGDGAARWPGFVLRTCAALGGDLRVAALTAAAVELAVTAIDVVDDLIDGDFQGSGLALDATARKSGSLCAMACMAGASLATDDPTALELVGRFGRYAGITAQLLNDLEGVSIEMRPEKSDFRQRKKTVPTAYLLHCATTEDIPLIRDWYAADAAYSAVTHEALATAAHDLGALTYTWVVADVHRREGLQALSALQDLTGREEVRLMRAIMPSVRARRVRAAA